MFKKIGSLFLLISLFFSCTAAALLELNDRISNTGLFLGDNPAVPAYGAKALIGLGSSGYVRHLQNSELLNDAPPYYYKDLNPPTNSSYYGIFNYPVSNLWLTLKYNRDLMTFFSYKVNNDDDKDLYNSYYSQGTTEKTSFTLSWEILAGNFLGLEVGSNRSVTEYRNKNSPALEDIASIHSYYHYVASNKYSSLNLGYIGNINELMRISISQKFSEKARIHSFCDYYPVTDGDYTQEMPNSTALGLIFELNKNFEIALGQEAIWAVKYISDFENRDDADQKTYYYLPYNLYTLAMALDYDFIQIQLIGSTGRQIGAYDIEEDSNSFNRGYAYTSTGFNVQVEPVQNNKVILGVFHYKLVEEREENPGQAWTIDNTRAYLGYAYYFDVFEQSPAQEEDKGEKIEPVTEPKVEKEEELLTQNIQVPAEKITGQPQEAEANLIDDGNVIYKLSATKVKPGEILSISTIFKTPNKSRKGYINVTGLPRVIFQDLGDGFFAADINIPTDFQPGFLEAQLFFIDSESQLLNKNFKIRVEKY